MSRQNLQIPENKAGYDGAFNLGYHTDMVRDSLRVNAFKNAFSKVIKPGSKILECGCGSGILSILASLQGGEVTSVEIDEKVAQLADSNFKKNKQNIDLIVSDIYKTEDILKEKGPFDIIIAEQMSIWCIDEPQVPICNFLSKFLAEDGVMIPGRVTNLVSLGYFEFGNDIVDAKFPFAKFSGVPDATPFTTSKVAKELNLTIPNSDTVQEKLVFDTLVSGEINSVILSSIVELVPGINFYSSDTLMPITMIPITPLQVQKGNSIELCYSYKHRSRLEEATFIVQKYEV